MNASFYPAVLLLALCAACGGGAEQPEPEPEQLGTVFTLPPGAAGAWTMPAEGEWAERWLSHLRSGSKQGLRFSKQRLLEMGQEAAPVLEEAMLEGATREQEFGPMVSMAEVMAGCGRPESVEVLLHVVETTNVAVVRTATLEALGALASADAAPRLIALLPHLGEVAPRLALISALGKIGSDEALAKLEELVRAWLDGAPGTDGQYAWNALLLSESENLLPILQRLEPKLPPFQTVQSLAARVAAGETGLEEKLRVFLDAQAYPSPETRSLALASLAELGDWEAVMSAREDPAPQMWMALVAALRRPDAAEAGIGEDLLDLYAQSEDQDLMFNALLGLVERGQSHRLDPWLRLLREFPTASASMTALQVVSKPGMQDPRTAGILIARWPQCTPTYRLDLIGALVRTEDPEAAAFLGRVVRDREEAAVVREKAATALANFDELAIEPLLALWEAVPTLTVASWILPGLGRNPSDPRVRAFLMHLAGDPALPDAVRKETMDMLPRIFAGEALGMLRELQDAEPRAEVRRYLDHLLATYF